MVDPIAPTGLTPLRQVAAVSAAPVVAKVAPAAPEPQPQETQVATVATRLAADLSAQPPVDTDRIARIKKAIAEGTFPILPATIADRMLALRYDWMSDDAA